MDRRSFLATGATLALLPLAEAPALARRREAGQRRRAAQRSCSRTSSRSGCAIRPSSPSSLGLDKGPNAALKSKLDTDPRRSHARRASRATAAPSPQLNAISPATLTEPPSSTAKSCSIRSKPAPSRRRGGTSIPRSAPIRSPSRAAPISRRPTSSTPRTRSTTPADAEAYLSRLSQFATVLDNDTAEQRAQAARGFLAPGWSIDLALGQMRKLRERRARAEHDGRIRSSSAPPRRALAATGSAAPRDDRRQAASIPRSTARSRRWSS